MFVSQGRVPYTLEQKSVYAKMDKAELAALALQKLIDAGIVVATD
jgi:hypothetical protein